MSKFKRVKTVTLPVLKLVPGKLRYLKILSPITIGKAIDDKKEPAHICTAVDLESYEIGIVVCPLIMRKELSENYAGDGYVNKCFEIVVTRAPGKAYNHVTLIEVAEPDEFEANYEAARTAATSQMAGDVAANAAVAGAPAGDTFDEMGQPVAATEAPARRGRR